MLSTGPGPAREATIPFSMLKVNKVPSAQKRLLKGFKNFFLWCGLSIPIKSIDGAYFQCKKKYLVKPVTSIYLADSFEYK